MKTRHSKATLAVITMSLLAGATGLEAHASALAAPPIARVPTRVHSLASVLAAPNLIVNGDAESGSGSTDGGTGGTPVPGWQISGQALANSYSIGTAFQQSSDPGPVNRGKNYLAGGRDNQSSSFTQSIDLTDRATQIDNGRVRFVLSGWLGGHDDQGDSASVTVTFRNALGENMGQSVIGPVSAKDRGNVTGLYFRQAGDLVPVNVRSADVVVLLNASTPIYNDAAADNLSLVLYDDSPLVTNLPPELYRRALRHLESLRGSPLAPGWLPNARLGPVAYPLFRPDLGDTVAYYDIPVYTVTVSLGAATQAKQPSAFINPLIPAGFIVVSTGEHDFPIPHWSSEGESPTRLLARLSAEQQLIPARFFRMDALNYVAEDANGNKTAEIGTPVNRIINQAAYMTATVELTAKTWSAIGSGVDIGSSNAGTFGAQSAQEISHTLAVSGPPTGTFQLATWGSLSELKDGYSASYGSMINSLRSEASGDWQVETVAAEIGEALRKGETFDLPLLSQSAVVTVSGPGVSLIQSQTITGTNGLPIFRIIVIGDQAGKEVPFTATISAPAEIVRFTIIPTVLRVYLPVLMKAATTDTSGQALMPARPVRANQASGWGPWNYFWAGSHSDQRLYGQIAANTPPNTSGCTSGCGPTAWAMLFGWADNQAAFGNPAWSGRNGIYRQNGGYGADAVAPRNQDSGVNAMTWELRGRVGTFCAFGNGPTFPWNMDSAQGYLSGRSYASVTTHYNVLGWHEDRLRNYAIDSIVYRHTPAIIGTGWLTHYPLAYGYAWTSRRVRKCFLWCWDETEYARSFYVNQGWPGASNNFAWVSSGTWFAGEIRR